MTEHVQHAGRARQTSRIRAAQRALLPPERNSLLSALGAVLCEPTRAKIVLALSPGELTVGELAEVLGRSESATSQHLRVLRDHGVVRSRKRGRMVHYSLSDIPIAKAAQSVMGTVYQVCQANA